MRRLSRRLNQPVQLNLSPEMKAALEEAASRDMASLSDFVRRATVEKIRAFGIELPGTRNSGDNSRTLTAAA
jgi:hypothetical protein